MGISEVWSREGIEVSYWYSILRKIDAILQGLLYLLSTNSYTEQGWSVCLAPSVCSHFSFLSWPCCDTASKPTPGYWLLTIWTSHPPEARANQTATLWRCSSVGSMLTWVKLWIWSPALSEAKHRGTHLMSSQELGKLRQGIQTAKFIPCRKATKLILATQKRLGEYIFILRMKLLLAPTPLFIIFHFWILNCLLLQHPKVWYLLGSLTVSWVRKMCELLWRSGCS